MIFGRVARWHVVLELTERQSFDDTARAAMVTAEARRLGFRVSLDDTGSGHNGLAHVQELSVDIIKIDKKFIDLVERDHAAKSIIQMLVRLARELDMSTVAEGIETESQRAILRECGVDEGQGYLVSPALRSDQFFRFLDDQSRTLRSNTQNASIGAA